MDSITPRFALLTPYSGHNLGDAAILEAMMLNLRRRVPDARFSGITLNSVHFLERHGDRAFDLCCRQLPYFGMSNRSLSAGETTEKPREPMQRSLGRRALSRLLRPMRPWVKDMRHGLEAARFLRGHAALIVNGGGQLDDLWGGAMGHPFALQQFTAAAVRTRVPIAFAAVGAGRLHAAQAQRYVARALACAGARSFREAHSRELAAQLLPAAANDPVVPDLAFSLPDAALPAPRVLAMRVERRPVVAVSPIAYANPAYWPAGNHALYKRYLGELAQLIESLEKRGATVLLVWSSLNDRASVVPELLACVEPGLRAVLELRLAQTEIACWQDFVAILRSVDCLVASRLHSVILAAVAETPAVALSFDPKVNWVMEDLAQQDALLSIASFTALEVVGAVECVLAGRADRAQALAAYRAAAAPVFESEFDRIVKLAGVGA